VPVCLCPCACTRLITVSTFRSLVASADFSKDICDWPRPVFSPLHLFRLDRCPHRAYFTFVEASFFFFTLSLSLSLSLCLSLFWPRLGDSCHAALVRVPAPARPSPGKTARRIRLSRPLRGRLWPMNFYLPSPSRRRSDNDVAMVPNPSIPVDPQRGISFDADRPGLCRDFYRLLVKCISDAELTPNYANLLIYDSRALKGSTFPSTCAHLKPTWKPNTIIRGICASLQSTPLLCSYIAARHLDAWQSHVPTLFPFFFFFLIIGL
jgi:hypothetical protein